MDCCQLPLRPGGKILGGTTTEAGTGGEKKASEAQLYIMDMGSKKLDWHAAISYGELHLRGTR